MAAGGGGARRGLLKRKPNFTLQEIDILMSEVLKYEQLLFGAAASTVNAYEKQKIWWRITNKINAAGRNQRDIGEVKNRWRGLRRRAGDKITRHRQERQGPAARPGTRTGAREDWDTDTGMEDRDRDAGGQDRCRGDQGRDTGDWDRDAGDRDRCQGGRDTDTGDQDKDTGDWDTDTGDRDMDTGDQDRCQEGRDTDMGDQNMGVKEEAVKEEPVEVKTEPFHSPATDSIPGRGAERRLPHAGTRLPGELCEGWSEPPRPTPPELSLGDLGGQQEPLGSDFPSILFEQEAEHLNNCGAGEPGPAGTTGLSDGAPDCTQLTPAEKRIVQSNERLVQEMRAFRREYAESRRETTSVLRVIAQALGGLSRSLAEIRDLYLREQAVPKP
ncbi:LOW QUALITY PROTEIN: uncharacterized protein LOC132319688 [Gavia stellata]|uniref:LOW QUALITY PROTEIN: uncharacterized protein LOC132319688 n=1 Tax=Gavia stellata TaxID=37040 RepID=UPI00289AAE8E|nr:LOW QUALITY PROTEIN: uncharacterized protein LOC132319688 [Gavia stellata]